MTKTPKKFVANTDWSFATAPIRKGEIYQRAGSRCFFNGEGHLILRNGAGVVFNAPEVFFDDAR